MKCLLTLLAIAAGLTIAASPRFQRALFYRDAPATPDDWAPKYMIGGRYATEADWPPPPVTDPDAFVKVATI